MGLRGPSVCSAPHYLAAGVSAIAQRMQDPSYEGCLDRLILPPHLSLTDVPVVLRSPALPVMPHRRGWFQGVVH